MGSKGAKAKSEKKRLSSLIILVPPITPAVIISHFASFNYCLFVIGDAPPQQCRFAHPHPVVLLSFFSFFFFLYTSVHFINLNF